jgi:hypothetical protein
VSQACQVMGHSRDSFLPVQGTVRHRRQETLREISRRKPNLRNRIAADLEDAIVAMAIDQPAWGQHRVANELAKQERTISSAGVRGVWVRHELATMKQRLKALEAKVAQDGRILTEAQLAALERVQRDKEAHGEFESECPGYCGAQDTVCVGTLEGSGQTSTCFSRSTTPYALIRDAGATARPQGKRLSTVCRWRRRSRLPSARARRPHQPRSARTARGSNRDCQIAC